MLATAGGSPGWLLGPLRFAGAPGADGRLAGPLFYAGLWLALALYVAVLATARALPVRAALGAVVALHVLFLLAPPLLSQDVFSYIAYARLGVEHHLNPYVHAPTAIPHDAVYGYAGSKDAVSAYGPLFTLLTYPLAPLGVAAAFWILKVVAAGASLGIMLLVWRIAQRLGRDPLVPALAVGLHPLVLSHVVAGGHNEALVVLLTMAGVSLWVAGRDAPGAAVATVAAGVKASAGLVVPFLIAARRPRLGAMVGAAAAAVIALAAIGLAAFGSHALDAFRLIGDNQGRSSRFSLPYKTAQLLGALLPGDRLDYRDAVRALFAAAFAAALLWLVWRTWRGLTPALDAIGWATLAILLASAWLVPWYVLWLLPFAALSRDRRLWIATLALSAWMLAIAVPL
ncbi:MAG: glycosyltransferase 87 family protein [Thermoleophilaceae bacterium]